MPLVPTEDLIDAVEVARLLGLSHRNTVSQYLLKYPEMPRPSSTLAPAVLVSGCGPMSSLGSLAAARSAGGARGKTPAPVSRIATPLGGVAIARGGHQPEPRGEQGNPDRRSTRRHASQQGL